jgi:hypothetical protein
LGILIFNILYNTLEVYTVANKKSEKEEARRKLDKLRRGKSEKRANRERNVGHENDSEHSRVSKGNKKTGPRGSGGSPRRK